MEEELVRQYQPVERAKKEEEHFVIHSAEMDMLAEDQCVGRDARRIGEMMEHTARNQKCMVEAQDSSKKENARTRKEKEIAQNLELFGIQSAEKISITKLVAFVLQIARRE